MTTYDLMHDTTELRKELQTATWTTYFDETDPTDESICYEAEIDGKTFYKVEYFDGSVEYSDDPAVVTGYGWDC